MKKHDSANLLRSVGNKLIEYVKNELCMAARFIATAAGYAEYVDSLDLPTPVPIETIGTNGTIITYNSRGLLDLFERNPKLVTRTYAHLIFHCLYIHYAKASVAENRLAWDVASDIAAEYLTDKLNVECVDEPEGAEVRKVIYERFEAACPLVSAEYVYEEIKFLSTLELSELVKPFKRDDHILWNSSDRPDAAALPRQGSDSDGNDGNAEAPETEDGKTKTPVGIQPYGDHSFEEGFGALGIRGSDRKSIATSADDWKRIAERVKLDIETFSTEYGSQTADLRRIINVELRSAYDYREFLRKFMVLKELMKEDLTQFDYIYYNLGLMMYGNIPLYDHPEYAIDYSLEDFVIAIDSSGSVFYDLAVNFLEECYAIIAQATTIRRRINLHIIQCDAAVKEDVLITGYDDFTKFMKAFTLRGGGGTDFRPVFNKVDELIAQGKFDNLKGLVYFTDGRGKYPEKPPKYDVAFVFYGNKKNDYETPPWAMKLIIGDQEPDKKRPAR